MKTALMDIANKVITLKNGVIDFSNTTMEVHDVVRKFPKLKLTTATWITLEKKGESYQKLFNTLSESGFSKLVELLDQSIYTVNEVDCERIIQNAAHYEVLAEQYMNESKLSKDLIITELLFKKEGEPGLSDTNLSNYYHTQKLRKFLESSDSVLISDILDLYYLDSAIVYYIGELMEDENDDVTNVIKLLHRLFVVHKVRVNGNYRTIVNGIKYFNQITLEQMDRYMKSNQMEEILEDIYLANRIRRNIPKHLIKEGMTLFSQIEKYNLPDWILNKLEVVIWNGLFDNKKAFLNQLSLFQEEIGVVYDALIFYLDKHINLNTLSVDQIKEACRIRYRDAQIKTSQNLTYQEFKYLNSSDTIQEKVFNALNELKVDERMRIMLAIPKINADETKYTVDQWVKMILEKIRSDKQFIHYKSNYKHLSKETAFMLYVSQDKIPQHLISQVTTDSEVKLLVRNNTVNYASIYQLKKDAYEYLPEMKSFKDVIGLPETFYEQYEEAFFRFFETGVTRKIVKYLAKNYELRENLQKIVKAAILGKINLLKYNKDDLRKELDFFVEEEQLSKWQKAPSVRFGRVHAYEATEFEQIFDMGEVPNSTCLSWNNGSASQCLLSMFDANKKLLHVTYDGKVVGRAILRFTKISNKIPFKEKSEFGFIDLAPANKSTVQEDENKEPVKEELVLFLEGLYTSRTEDNEDLPKALYMLAKQVAESLNVKLLLASDYYKFSQEKYKGYIYISKSKNGFQYLDSFGGNHNTSKGGKYVSCSSYIG